MELTNEAKATFERLFGSQPQPDKRDPELLAILQNQIFRRSVFNRRAR